MKNPALRNYRMDIYILIPINEDLIGHARDLSQLSDTVRDLNLLYVCPNLVSLFATKKIV